MPTNGTAGPKRNGKDVESGRWEVVEQKTQLSTHFSEAVKLGIIKKQKADKKFYFGVAPTLLSTDSKGPLLVLEKRKELNAMNELPKCQVVGTLENSGTTQEHNNSVYSVDGLSPTLTAVSGGTHHIKIFDPAEYRVRKLTPTEYGRLQAFPMDRWKQVVSDSQAYKQFGNAVTVTVFSAIAAQIAKAIYEEEERNAGEAPEDMEDKSMDFQNNINTKETQGSEENTETVEAAEPLQPMKRKTMGELAEMIIAHLYEKTFLAGYIFEDAQASLTDFLENNMAGAYLEAQEQEETRNWEAAASALTETLIKYSKKGPAGMYGVKALTPLLERLERGERTPELFNIIVDATR